MPRFKTTENIFKNFLEIFDENWMDHNTLQLPSNLQWDYSRPLQLEDVDIWEVIYEQNGGIGVYASWCPYAEFYLIRVGWFLEFQGYGSETYYGPGAVEKVILRCKELNIPININKIWVDPKDMWIY